MVKSSNTPEARPGGFSVGAIIAALVVIGVFVVLGFVLANSNPVNQTAGSDVVPTAVTSATAETQPAPDAPAAGAASDTVAARADKYSAAPPLTIDVAKSYLATITTPRGDIEIKLRPDLAPETVNSFVFLANEGYYDGITWHRVLPNFMAQGGDPTGTGMGGPGYTVKGEFTDKVLFDKPGIVAMARPSNDVNGNGSQFFITTAPFPSLNSQYTVFGEVTKGQEIVDAIPLRDPDQSPSTPGEQIVKVSIREA